MIYIAFVDDAGWARPFVERHLKEITPYQVLNVSEDSSKEPDIVFFGDGKAGSHLKFNNSKLVFITCEDLYPDFSKAHFIISCRYVTHERYLRVPYWALIYQPEILIKRAGYADGILRQPRDFCAFVQSNSNPRRTRRRLDFFNALSKRRFVHSGGSVQNNIGYRVEHIHQFLAGFKLYICFENARSEGYTTEKLVNGMINGCIPIYWGDPLVHLDFNPRSFIDVARFSSEPELLDHVERVAEDENLRRAYLEEPFFHGNTIPDLFKAEKNTIFFKKLLDDPVPRRKVFSVGAQLDKLKHRLRPYLFRGG